MRLWVDNLYGWIAVPESLYRKKLGEHWGKFGIGSLTISEGNIVTEVEPSINQGKLPIDIFTRFGFCHIEAEYEDGSREKIGESSDLKKIIEHRKDKDIEDIRTWISKAPNGGGQKQRKEDRLENHPFTKKLFQNWKRAKKGLEEKKPSE